MMTRELLRAHDLLNSSRMPQMPNDTPLPDWALAAWLQDAPMVVRRAPRGAGRKSN